MNTNPTTKILATAKALPPHTKTTEEILPVVEAWLAEQPKRFRDKVLRIFKYAQVDRRYSIMDLEDVFTKTSFEEKNKHYAIEMTKLAELALQKALDKAELQPTDIDFIITTSCTGIMIPSVDAFLINSLKMKQDVVRMPITEMGCAAGVSALIYAHDLLKSNPGKRAAIVALESPTSTFQLDDFSMTNMVSAAIFGDGVAATILGPSDDKVLPVIKDTGMYHFFDELHMMGFNLTNGGLQMVLDPSVPEKIQEHFDDILLPFLERNQLEIKDLEHFIFHPGGKKIVKMVEDLLHDMGKNINITKEVLRIYGNMSSATVLYVLEEYLNKEIPAGEKGLMLSFGPGFSAQRVLLEWE
ncbi:putative naringenin-chalcone synthase [Owenweeksia hongkongensis DSM 17368]|uniref:Putative naringenin-chalcone synthase n=1 Tax=Owenweeksia hongkongensis (strain DSM 17368 / CIP 108786 / JCM 12287 / NRRL B-23963 / UST20020801) TaxID=926562 RepID=G8R115_OWEHD|nr:type III polyketide synthase [Owenweeksia hongkongensis]AEV31686.1 putative naringenin-chalcone synthase [Owenweeksia hongkongensis DSM 17368]